LFGAFFGLVCFVDLEKLGFGPVKAGMRVFVKGLVLLSFLNCVEDDFLPDSRRG
jgi:hypothetical protein